MQGSLGSCLQHVLGDFEYKHHNSVGSGMFAAMHCQRYNPYGTRPKVLQCLGRDTDADVAMST